MTPADRQRRIVVAALLVGLAACSQSPTVHTRVDAGGGDAGAVDGGSSLHDGGGGGDAGGTDAGVCTPTATTETTCDGRDDDCNGIVDDVDAMHDGICDCLAIGILGAPGANPSSSFQTWLTSRGTTVTRFGTAVSDAITPSTLAPYDVVVLDALPRTYTTAEANALRDFVQAGGGLMSMTGHDGSTDRGNASSLLASLGVEYAPGLVSGPVTTFVPHALTTGLSSVTFEGGYHVATTAALTGTSTIVATLPDGPVGLALELGTGRAFVWGDEWVEFDSQWTTMPEIAQFWTNAFGWLAPVSSCRTLI